MNKMQYMNVTRVKELLAEIQEEIAKPNPGEIIDEVLTTGDVAKILKMSPSKVSRMALLGELHGWRIGNQWRFMRSDIQKGFSSDV